MKSLLVLAFVFLILVLPKTVWGATYFIDFVGGSDSNIGISKSAPLKHAPGMQGCLNICGSTIPQAGDRFIFKGGVAWDRTSFPLNIAWSGTAGNPIYFGVD